MAGHCQATGGIGWIFGHLIDGTQAEYARVPFAETTVHKVPEGVTDEQVLFLADILPTGYEVGVRTAGSSPATWSWSSARARSAWPRSRPRRSPARQHHRGGPRRVRLEQPQRFGADAHGHRRRERRGAGPRR